jgi:hypothetical protein
MRGGRSIVSWSSDQAAGDTSAARRYALAPMSRAIRVLTWVLLAIPVAFVAIGLAVGQPLRSFFPAVGLAIAALYAGVWIWWRPARFEVSSAGLRICFPGRARFVPASDLAGARTLDGRVFRNDFGLALRVGVGGLWGGFGWLWTRQRGFVEFYVSRVDGLVLVERRGGRPILFTPADPDEVARSLSGVSGRSARSPL